MTDNYSLPGMRHYLPPITSEGPPIFIENFTILREEAKEDNLYNLSCPEENTSKNRRSIANIVNILNIDNKTPITKNERYEIQQDYGDEEDWRRRKAA